MLSHSFSTGILGIEGYLVQVDAEVRHGLPCLTISNLTGALDEARERVRWSLSFCGHTLPARQQVVKLEPQGYKDSPGCDLAIACALLAAHEVIPQESLQDTMLWGELGTDGTLRPSVGTLVAADLAHQRRMRIILPEACAAEAALIDGLTVIAARDLAQVVAVLRGELEGRVVRSASVPTYVDDSMPDLADIRGLALPKRALEVMLAGGHSMLLHGPRGSGKTMLARRIAGLLPPLDHEHALEVTKIHGIALRRGSGLIRRPPVRMPHHTVSVAGLLGGGNPPRPGEVSLAHRGVLFLDELPEFPRAALEGLREPLEDKSVSLVRARYAVHYPANFQMFAAMSPCPCGYLGHPERVCTDSLAAVLRWQQRIPQSFIDRFDIQVSIDMPKRDAFMVEGESSATVRERISLARDRQLERLEDTPWASNAEVPAEKLELDSESQQLLHDLNYRGTRRAQVIRIARTLQDLTLSITNPHEPIHGEAMLFASRMLPRTGTSTSSPG